MPGSPGCSSPTIPLPTAPQMCPHPAQEILSSDYWQVSLSLPPSRPKELWTHRARAAQSWNSQGELRRGAGGTDSAESYKVLALSPLPSQSQESWFPAPMHTIAKGGGTRECFQKGGAGGIQGPAPPPATWDKPLLCRGVMSPTLPASYSTAWHRGTAYASVPGGGEPRSPPPRSVIKSRSQREGQPASERGAVSEQGRKWGADFPSKHLCSQGDWEEPEAEGGREFGGSKADGGGSQEGSRRLCWGGGIGGHQRGLRVKRRWDRGG